MKTQRKAFSESFAQAKAENRLRATLIRTVPMRDPFEVYRSICECSYPCEIVCMMESTTHDGSKGRFSYVCMGGNDYMTLNGKSELGWLKEMLRRDCPPAHPTLLFVGGAVGYLSHELITLVETSKLKKYL